MEIKKDDASYIFDEWYSYLNSDFQMLSYGPYEDAGEFDFAGYAVVSIRHDWYGHKTWGVIDKTGNYICDLPDLNLGKADNWYTSCNGYFAIGGGYSGSYGMETERPTAVVNIQSGEIVEYQSIEFVDKTDCTIVQDLGTDLYGMFEGEKQRLQCVYDTIVFDGNQNIVATRGSKQETITLEETESNFSSVETSLSPVLVEKTLEYMQSNYPNDEITELEINYENGEIISCSVQSSGYTAFIGADIYKKTKEVKLYNDSGREIEQFEIS